MRIGQALLDRLIADLGPIPVVTLFCSDGLAGYYAACAFEATGQVVMHRTAQN